MLNNILKYFIENKWYTLIINYFLFSCLIKSFFGIDICIPCLWNFLFDFHCPGCGLTTAFIHLLNFEFKEALMSNVLIVIILPFAIMYITYDFMKFIKKQTI
jgi:hypothetical protein